jgi:hypothetical protein
MPFDRELVEAKLALKLIPPAEMPNVGIEALEAGLDGPAIRRLAVLDHPTYFEVAEVLPRALAEMGLKQLSSGEAALRIARRRAKEILDSGESPYLHVIYFQELWINADYPGEISSVGNLNDDIFLAEARGESEPQIEKWMKERLQNLIR